MEKIQAGLDEATELGSKPEAVQVAKLLTVMREEACDVFSTFTDWAEEGDATRIEPVLMTFSPVLSAMQECAT